MKKAVTLIALASVAMATEIGDFHDNNLNIFKKIGGGLKKAGQWIGKHPEVITTAIKILALEDQVDNELFSFKDLAKKGKEKAHKIEEQIKKLKELAAQHPELVEKVKELLNKYKDTKTGTKVKKVADFIKKLHGHKVQTVEHDDDELHIRDFIHRVTEGVKKGAHFVKDHPHVVKDTVTIAKDIKNKDYKQAISDTIKALQDLGFEDEELFVEFNDEELFNFNDFIHQAQKGIEFVQEHPAILGDGLEIYNDIKTHQFKKLPSDIIKTLKDLGFEDEELFVDIEFDDDELFNFKNFLNNVKKGAKKGIDFLKGHPELIKDGVNIAKDIKGHKYGQLIKDGVEAYKHLGFEDEELFVEFDDEFFADEELFVELGDDEFFADDELFNIKKAGGAIKNGVKKGVGFVKKHPEIIKDGVNIAKDIKGRKYGQLIKHGVDAYKHLGFEDEELFVELGDDEFFADEELFADFEDQDLFELAEFDDNEFFNVKDAVKKGTNFVKEHPAIIKDGINIAKDVKNKQIGNLIRDGAKLYRDLGFEDQTDNSLFSLGDLVKDGLHIAHDIKTKNYEDLVHHGIKTVKDLKNKEKKFLF